MRAFFRSTPRSLIEAARIDGATSFGVLWRVLLPQAWPAVLTMSLLVFTYTWNEFLLALVLVSGSESHQTAPLGLSFFAGAARAGDPTEGRRGRSARRAADPRRISVPATALRPRNARRGTQGVR